MNPWIGPSGDTWISGTRVYGTAYDHLRVCLGCGASWEHGAEPVHGESAVGAPGFKTACPFAPKDPAPEPQWLAQNGEDRVIAAYLAEHHPTLVGRVLDIGAHDGWSLSNTARLLERGWGGTLVEASPRPLAKLIDRWGDREDIEIVGACLITNAQRTAPEECLVRWYDDAGAACHAGESFLSTTETANVEKWRGATKFRRAWLAALPAELFVCLVLQDTPARAWDMWSIDVEGTSVALLQELTRAMRDMGARLPLLVVVEHDDMHAKIAQWCATYGYRVLEANAENVIAARA